jgi:taurine dioxygenase
VFNLGAAGNETKDGNVGTHKTAPATRAMPKVASTGQSLGATIEGLDLAKPQSSEALDLILRALGQYGVVRFPRQELSTRQFADFSARFGMLEINVANAYQAPGIPEVMILSNIVQNGKPIGLADAGQGWHTDMSYSKVIAFANVLYGVKIPQRDGRPLGATEFSNMHAAYDELPVDLRERVEGMTVLHDFNKFWEMMRREKGSPRPPLTEAQRQAKPPVSHPIFLTHPLTRRKVLYANPGYSVRINELPQKESDEVLEFLFAHQLKPEFRYAFHWQEGDVLMWDDIGTVHNAVADYGPDEHRLIKRCQVMASMYYGEQ